GIWRFRLINPRTKLRSFSFAAEDVGGCHRESVRVGVDELVTRADAVSEQVAFVGQAGGLADECGLDAPFGQHDRVDLVVAVAGPPWPDGDHLGAERAGAG